jgi:hypothetical protein
MAKATRHQAANAMPRVSKTVAESTVRVPCCCRNGAKNQLNNWLNAQHVPGGEVLVHGRVLGQERDVVEGDGRAGHWPPSTVTVPSVGTVRPAAMFISVDLPAPFGPTSAARAPAGTARVQSSSAHDFPYRLPSPSVSMTFTRLPPFRCLRHEHDQWRLRAP